MEEELVRAVLEGVEGQGQGGREREERIWESLINRLVLSQARAQLTSRSSAVSAALQPTV